MPSKLPRYNLRTDKEILQKLNYISAYKGRTANKEIEYLTRKHIEEFEKKYGTITFNE